MSWKRGRGRLLAAVLLLLAILPNVSAFEIKLARTNYFPYETLQAEITGNFTSEISLGNIFFMLNGKETELPAYLVQLSNQQYFLYTELPRKPGNWSLVVKNIFYYENGTLKGEKKQQNFTIEDVAVLYYTELIEDIQKGWPSDVESISYYLIALAYDSKIASAGRDALLAKSKNNGECWPSPTCNVRETALAVLALKRIGEDVSKAEAWLLDAQNNLEIGVWNLIVDSTVELPCTLNINNKTKNINITSGLNSLELEFDSAAQPTVSINCSAAFSSAKIVHTYLGTIHEFNMSKWLNYASVILNNEKCFGSGYRNSCDADATACALLALDALANENQLNDAATWLEKNALTTKQKALAYLYTSSSKLQTWLINNQDAAGYWSSTSLLENKSADVEATLWASYALTKKQKDASEKGRSWLKIKLPSISGKQKALVLAYDFPSHEKLLSVKPAIFKTKTNSTLQIELANHGLDSIVVNALFNPFNEKKEITIEPGNRAKLNFDVPSGLKNFWRAEEISDVVKGSIEISYIRMSDKDVYDIPVIIMPRPELLLNKTIEVVAEHFGFSPERLSATIFADEEMLFNIRLRNLSPRPINNISFVETKELARIINITPSFIGQLPSGGDIKIMLTIKAKAGNYSGFIEARSSERKATFEINISVTKNVSMVNVSNITDIVVIPERTCTSINGKVCSKNETCSKKPEKLFFSEDNATYVDCCLGECIVLKVSKINKGKIVGIAMLVVAFLLVLIFFLSRLKKPEKEELREVVERIEKRYKPEERLERAPGAKEMPGWQEWRGI